MIEFLESLGIKVPLLLSGFAGGLATLDRKEKITWFAKFISLVSGAFSANYLTPVVGDWISLSHSSMYGLSFLIGYGGLKFIEIIYLELTRKIKRDDKNNNLTNS